MGRERGGDWRPPLPQGAEPPAVQADASRRGGLGSRLPQRGRAGPLPPARSRAGGRPPWPHPSPARVRALCHLFSGAEKLMLTCPVTALCIILSHLCNGQTHRKSGAEKRLQPGILDLLHGALRRPG